MMFVVSLVLFMGFSLSTMKRCCCFFKIQYSMDMTPVVFFVFLAFDFCLNL